MALVRLVLALQLALASAAWSTTTDMEPQTQNSPLVATPEAVKSNPFSGSASYAYRFDVPPGTGGLTPELMLLNSTATKHTEYGYGWNLNLGFIERSTRFGPPIYDDPASPDASDPDEYELDGEILVRHPDPGQTTRFFKRLHDGSRILYFATGDYWEVTDPQGTRYLYAFRAAADSRLTHGKLDASGDPTGPTFRWALDTVIDARGNAYHIDYVADAYQVLDGLSDDSFWAYIYPRELRYSYHYGGGDKTATPTTGMAARAVVFTWDENRGDTLEAGTNRCLDCDRPTSYRARFKVQRNWRLAEIRVGIDTDGDADSDGNPIELAEEVRRYALQYAAKPTSPLDELPAFSRLDAIQRHGVGDDGMGSPVLVAFPDDVNPIPTRFEYSPELRSYSDTWVEWENSSAYGQLRHTENHLTDYTTLEQDLHDMNGDGFLDVVDVQGTTWMVRYGSTGGFGAEAAWQWPASQTPGCETEYRETLRYSYTSGAQNIFQEFTIGDVLDLNGDGLPDRVTYISQGHYLCFSRNNGAGGFDAAQIWAIPLSGIFQGFEVKTVNKYLAESWHTERMMDVNGDGRPDHISSFTGLGPPIDPNGPGDYAVTVMLNLGDGLASAMSYGAPDGWSGDLESFRPGQYNHSFGWQFNIGGGAWHGNIQSWLDVNGDGFPDRIADKLCFRMADRGEVKGIAFGMGMGWQYASGTGQWHLETPVCDGDDLFIPESVRKVVGNKTHAAVMDLNGDGWLDVLSIEDYASGLPPSCDPEMNDTAYIVMYGLGDGTFLTTGTTPSGHPEGAAWCFGPWIRDANNDGNSIFDTIDLNGDGLLDQVSVPYDEEGNWLGGNWLVSIHPGPAGMLKKVTNEIGGTTEVSHTPTNHVVAEEDPSVSEAGLPANIVPNGAPGWMVETITTSDGRSGSPDQVEEFRYAGPRYDLDRREFAGVRVADQTRVGGPGALAHVLTRSFFHQGEERRGRAEWVEVHEYSGAIPAGGDPPPNDVLLRKTEFDYSDPAGGSPPVMPLARDLPASSPSGPVDVPGSWMPFPSQTTETLYDPASPTTFVQHTVSRTFDYGTGNLLSETDWGWDNTEGTADDLTRTYQYLDEEVDWLVAYRTTEHESIGGGAASLLQESFYADPNAAGRVSETRTHRDDDGTGTGDVLTERWTYDIQGNQTTYRSPVDVANNEPVATRRIWWDAWKTYPWIIFDANNLNQMYWWDKGLAKVSHHRDKAKFVQCWSYDAFGRLTERKSAPLAAVGLYSMASCDDDRATFSFVNIGLPESQHIAETVIAAFGAPNVELKSQRYFDGLGREYYTEAQATTGEFRSLRKGWNERGELSCEALPEQGVAISGNAPDCQTALAYRSHRFDGMGRATATRFEDSAGTTPELTVVYSVNASGHLEEQRTIHTGSDPNAPVDREVVRAFNRKGEILTVTEDTAITSFLHDERGRLTQIDGPDVGTDPNLLSVSYNNVGQRLTLTAPNGGVWRYSYDANGNLSTEESPVLAQTSDLLSYTYDRENRIKKKVFPDPTYDITYTYDNTTYSAGGLGKLFKVAGPNVTTKFYYKLRGMPYLKSRDFGEFPFYGDLIYNFSYLYDNADRLTKTIYPNGHSVEVAFDGVDPTSLDLSGTGKLVDSLVLNASGGLTDIDFIDNQVSPRTAVHTDYSYDGRHRLGAISTVSDPGGTPAALQTITYAYDDSGNVLLADDAKGLKQEFWYDALHRLDVAKGNANTGTYTGGAYGEINYDYDDAGNVKQIDKVGVTTYDLTYVGGAAGPHGVTSVSVGSGVVGTYGYDLDGAVSGRTKDGSTMTFTRDAAGRLESASVGASTHYFSYDDGTERVAKTGPDVYKYYVDADYEVDLSSVPAYHDIHAFVGGRRVATARYEGMGDGAPDAGPTVHFHHADYLGSNALVTDESGSVIQKTYFEPFGQIVDTVDGSGTPITAGAVSDHLFTDQENDPETELMYYGARYYDPWVGRFMRQDPALVLYEGVTFGRIRRDAREFNAYSYALNAPTVFVDPTGESVYAWYLRVDGKIVDHGLVQGEGTAGALSDAQFAGIGADAGAFLSGAGVGGDGTRALTGAQGTQVADLSDYVQEAVDAIEEVADAVVPDLDAAKKIAEEEIEKRPSDHNNLGDATRHAEASRRVAEEVNKPSAWIMGYGHELDNLLNGSPVDEVLMDLHNNAEGRAAAAEGRAVDPDKLITDPRRGATDYRGK